MVMQMSTLQHKPHSQELKSIKNFDHAWIISFSTKDERD